MMPLIELQKHLVERIDSRPVGSWSRYKLMNAANEISCAMAAEIEEDSESKPRQDVGR